MISRRKPEPTANDQLSPYMKSESVTLRRFRDFIPVMLITNLSNLLLVTANGLVAGNFVGSSGFACISLIEPVEALINTASTLAACSISTSLSKAMGSGDAEAFDRAKSISLQLMVVIALLAVVIELPVAWFVIRSYNLDAVMYDMTWKYALIRILSSPIEIVMTVCVYDLQVAGEMRAVMRHAILQGTSNLLFDLLFVAVLHLGVSGTGYGTACALLLRAIVAWRYIEKHTELFKRSRRKNTLSDLLEFLPCGLPDASHEIMGALQNYFLIKILLFAFGADGGIIAGVCNFCLAVASVLIRSVLNSTRPMIGLLAGADDRKELRVMMRQAVITDLVFVGIVVIFAELIPASFFSLYGVVDIPDGGLLSLRIYAPFILIYALNTLLRMYLSYCDRSKQATAATVTGTATLPVFSYAFVLWLGSPFLWLGYSASELLTMLLYLISLRHLLFASDEDEDPRYSLYLSLAPENAASVSETVMDHLHESGIDERLSYRVALCMEEIGAYAQNADRRRIFSRSDPVELYFRIKIINEQEALITVLDNGKCICLDQDDDYGELMISNHDLIRKIAKSAEYQYILNLNYIRIRL